MNEVGGFADRSERGKLRFAGEQRTWFLHQVLSQAFEDITAGEARDAAFLTAHGRMKAFMETVATEDALYMHFEPELRDYLPGELARYVFATRVEIEDVSDDLGLVLIVGMDWREDASRAAFNPIALHPTASLGVEAGYVWLPSSEVRSLLSALEAAGLRTIPEERLEDVRIEHGVARWGRDMNESSLPQEVGIDERAVHYAKGCYIGQEAMAKIHFRGKPNKRLAIVHTESALPPGTDLLLDDAKVGSITSSSGRAALALVRHTVASGTKVTANGVPATVAS